jgi:hypothetical protein
MSYPLIDHALQKFGQRADHLRQDLYYCDVLALQSSTRREVLSNVRAGVYVWLSSALECLLREVLASLVTYLNSANLTVSETRLSLFALLNASRLDSLQDIRGLRMWQTRADLFINVDGISACSFAPEVTPLDGRTIRLEHLQTLWQVFGFPGGSLPSPVHALVLADLADTRNELAHGHEDISVIAGRKANNDLLKFIDRIEEIATHMWSTVYEYLEKQAYRR